MRSRTIPFAALLVALLALSTLACSSKESSGPDPSPTTSTTAAPANPADMDPTAVVVVTPTGKRGDSQERTAEKVWDLGSGRWRVAAFVPACATVTDVSFDDAGASLWASDVSCSPEQVLVAVDVTGPQGWKPPL